MTIPEISPLFIISMCGLSTVCIGFFAVIAFMVIRFTSGELFDALGGLFDRGDSDGGSSTPERRPATASRDLRARTQQLEFDQSLQSQSMQPGQPSPQPPSRFGENPNLRPDRTGRLNERTRDWNLQPPGTMSDNPQVISAPPPPNFSTSGEYLPNERSNIGGRLGRHNTGRGQTGQRLDADFGSTSSGLGHSVPRTRGENRRSNRNAAYNDEMFGGKLDFDGDGDLDT